MRGAISAKRNRLKADGHKIPPINVGGQILSRYDIHHGPRALISRANESTLYRVQRIDDSVSLAYISRRGLSLSFSLDIPSKSSNEYRKSFYFSRRENIVRLWLLAVPRDPPPAHVRFVDEASRDDVCTPEAEQHLRGSFVRFIDH